MEKYDFSVVIVTHEQPYSIPLILKSLEKQTFEGSFEVIITDDGTQKPTIDFKKLNNLPYPVRYIWQQNNEFRASRARNNAIRMSEGKYILLLDGDMVPALDVLKMHSEIHDGTKRIIAGNRCWRGTINKEKFLKLINLSSKEMIDYIDHEMPYDLESKKREKTETLRRENWYKSSNPWRACFSSNVSFLRGTKTYFDEHFIGWSPEDMEFNYRLCSKLGYEPYFDKNIKAYHLEQPAAVGNVFRSGSSQEIYRYLSNTLYFLDKCPVITKEDILFGFPRFILNKKTNSWSAISREAVKDWDLDKKELEVRNWLKENST